MMFKQPRQHCEAHLKFVRGLPCLVCGDNTSTEAAHIRAACSMVGKRHVGLSEKSSDFWAVPLCGRHHRAQHSMNEEQFWDAADIDPFIIALALWAHTGNHEAGMQVIEASRSS